MSLDKIFIFSFLVLNVSCSETPTKSSVQRTSSESQNLTVTASCNYVGLEREKNLVGFLSDNEAEQALRRIIKFTGLPANFKIMAANVPNACAVIDGENRYILYSQEFMELVKNQTKTSWSEISILAHEIGHHLSGHTLEVGGSRPPIELEADKFSGFILAKMGASLDDALIAMKTLASDEGSISHPAKSARLAAISNGWKQARDIQDNEQVSKTPPENKAPIPDPSPARIPGIYPESSTRYLTNEDIDGKTNWELRIMRNEIYARKGYVFNTPQMSSYFKSQTWYRPVNDNKAIERGLTVIERANIDFIKSHE